LARKILLADDSVTAQNMGRKILADAGYDVLTVNNGSAALKKIAELKPDLIVLDVYMPGYSGLEVCQRLKDAGETAKIPILLTVGKLEPFKPEEAKRVRADGFIVKPFEASELLSALSKLEDKIVPTAEAARPGRFARVAAALDENSSKPKEASGWKSRLGFPKQDSKSKTAAEDAADQVADQANDSAIYNQVNRDLRTTIASKPAEKVHPGNSAGSSDDRVDLRVLATAGLPADVTTEEIAALATAAAQMKSKVAEATVAEAREVKIPEVKIQEAKMVEANAASQPVALQSEPTAEAKSESRDEKPATLAPEAVASVASPAPEPANQIASEPIPPATAESSSTDSDEPVTMAVATVSAPCASASRWTAVSIAPDPEESALTLEQEMQRAQAAVVDAPAPAATTAEISAPESATALPPADAAAEKVDLFSLTALAPDPSQSFTQAATEALSAAMEKLEAVASSHIESSHFESSHFESSHPESPQIESSHLDSQPASADVLPLLSELTTSPVAESNPVVETREETPAEVPVIEAQTVEANTEPVAAAENHPAAQAQDPQELESLEKEHQEQGQKEERHETVPAEVMSVAELSPALPELVAQQEPVAAQEQEYVAQGSAAQVSAAEAQPAVAAHAESHHDRSSPEAEIVATTAAAWASWRRIRESGDVKPAPPADSSLQVSSHLDASQPELTEMPVVHGNAHDKTHVTGQVTGEVTALDVAAMAVAVGAGNGASHTAAAADPATPEAIANIVDSILADMRPKILEEVSRKLRTN
jgi:CheY-like chemotaxis protein